MQIYEVTTDCLVMFGTLTWYVEAETPEDAELKGYNLVHSCYVADEGGIMVRPYTGDQDVVLDRMYEHIYE